MRRKIDIDYTLHKVGYVRVGRAMKSNLHRTRSKGVRSGSGITGYTPRCMLTSEVHAWFALGRDRDSQLGSYILDQPADPNFSNGQPLASCVVGALHDNAPSTDNRDRPICARRSLCESSLTLHNVHTKQYTTSFLIGLPYTT